MTLKMMLYEHLNEDNGYSYQWLDDFKCTP